MLRVVAAVALVPFVNGQMTMDLYTSLKKDVATYFGFVPSYGVQCNGHLGSSSNGICPMGDHMGALVRLVFHDAVGNGGPNGCIDWQVADHNGLQTIVGQLDDLYTKKNYSALGLSKADLWVLAGNTAVEYASQYSGGQVPVCGALACLNTVPDPKGLVLPFSYGRVDAVSCNDTGLLPNPGFTWAKTKALFGGRFNMSVPEAVAILGAHSLGRAEFANSGFEGGWITQQSSFSNQYYIAMGTVLWKNLNLSAGGPLWLDTFPNGPETMFLKVDAELLHDMSNCVQFNSFKASASCPLQTETYPYFMEYAGNITGNLYFYGNFSNAWKKMTHQTNLCDFIPVGFTNPPSPSTPAAPTPGRGPVRPTPPTTSVPTTGYPTFGGSTTINAGACASVTNAPISPATTTPAGAGISTAPPDTGSTTTLAGPGQQVSAGGASKIRAVSGAIAAGLFLLL